MKTRSPGPVHSGRADHVVADSTARTPGTGTDTTPSSDWLGEITEPAAPAEGVPIATRSKVDKRRGRAVESKRGQR